MSSGSTTTAVAGELGVALDGPDDRRARELRRAGRAEACSRRARDPPREAVELREGVLAQRDEDVDALRRREHRRERLGERPRPAVVGVVEEVLLRLVEDEVDVAVRLRAPRGRPRADPLAAPGRLRDRLGETAVRIVAPAREDDDERALGQLAQRARDCGAQERRLADAARPVEHREARRDEVGDDDLALALAPEEEEGVELRVLERVQALERRVGAPLMRRPRAAARAARRTRPGRRRAA